MLLNTLRIVTFKNHIFYHAPRIDSKLSRNLSQLQNLCFLRVAGASCHTTFNCMKSDIQIQLNKNISLLQLVY